MRTRLSIQGLALLATSAFLLGTGGSAEPSIVSESPFLPPGFTPPGNQPASTPATPTNQSGQYQFKGVYVLNDQYYYHLYDTRQSKGTWVTEETTDASIPKVIRYNSDEDTLLIDNSGRQMSLSMVKTSDRSLPVAGADRSINSTPNKPTNIKPTEPGAVPKPVRRRIIRPTNQGNPGEEPARRRIIVPPSRKQEP